MQEFYSTSRFAAPGCVSVRTLRYYDRMGLLSPSARTAAGHRQYTRGDLARLQQILALKFLGFSLSEIWRCLRFSPADMRDALSLQRTLLTERNERRHLSRSWPRSAMPKRRCQTTARTGRALCS
ncbi:MAG TPA: MerR family transcriptional regulator [Ktedonobacteraceae bacterium]|jgi:DNA-binding transcriptional MerR regulator